MNNIANKYAINYIESLIQSLLPGSAIKCDYDNDAKYYFHDPLNKIKVIFSREIIEDFQMAIEKHKNTFYYNSIEASIKFEVYATLGMAGLIPNFQISKEFLNETRDWKKNIIPRFETPEELYTIIYKGLKKLSFFLTDIVQRYTAVSEEIKRDQKEINHLIDWYDKNQSFAQEVVSVNYLGYLKAAAICIIIDKENEKRSTNISRILKGIDEEIYNIVFELRHSIFLEIKMSDCIYDYAQNMESGENSLEPNKSLIFIACGQLIEKEINLGKKIKELLKNNGIDSFLAEAVKDLESLNTHIFKNLKNCTGFIGILHKRDEGKYITSIWINQEVAIAAYLRHTQGEFPSLIFYEEGVATKEGIKGLIEYTIANPEKFKTDDEVLIKVKDWIKDRGFTYREKLPDFDLILNENHISFGSRSSSGRGYIDCSFSFRIRNKSDINICLEDVSITNEFLGKGKIGSRVSEFPFNIEAHKTEQIYLSFEFPNEIEINSIHGKDNKLQIEFKFSDRILTRELAGYL